MKRWFCFLLISCSTLFASPVSDPDASDRPLIGLALSGGGARGYAHIGVLQVFEELRVPVDFIAGTSMGSMVGGLYATGLSAEHIEDIMLPLVWPDLFDDEPARRERAYRRKEEDQRYVLDFEAGFRGGKLVLPRGLASGRKLKFFLRESTMPVTGIQDFDALPIPFRAVGTDLEKGNAVIIDQGDLSKAIRASMSLPGMFSPVVYGGQQLIDGGVVMNLPIDTVREMGADMVIAVDIGLPLRKLEEVKTLMDVSSQAMGVTSRKSVEEMLPRADLVLIPQIQTYGTLEFAAVAALIEHGRQEALAHRETLEKFSLSEADYARWRKQHAAPEYKPLPLHAIRFHGLSRVDPRTLAARIRQKKGDPFDMKQLGQDLDRIFGMGDFEWVDFEVYPEGIGVGVLITVKEKEWGPNYVRAGLNLTVDDVQNTELNPLINLTATRLNNLGAEWRTDLVFGEVQSLDSEFYQPLDYGERFFTSLELLYQRDTVPGAEATLYAGRLSLGTNLGAYGAIKAGVNRGEYDIRFDVDDHLAPEPFPIGSWFAGLEVDRLDSRTFPRKGTLLALDYAASRTELGGESDFELATFNHVFTASRGAHTFLSWIELGTALDNDDIPAFSQFPIGGFFSFSGYERAELFGPHYGIYRPSYIYQLGNLPSVVGKGIYLGGWLEIGNVWAARDQISTDDLRYAATLVLGAQTVVGPVYLALGFAEQDRHSFYISVGPSF